MSPIVERDIQHLRSSSTYSSKMMNSMHGEINKIYLLAVLRSSDLTVVASYQQDRDVTVEGVRECIAGNANMEIGKRYTSQGDAQSINYIIDPQGRVYAIVTNPSFSLRSAFKAIDDLADLFNRDLGSRIASATEQSLSQAASPIMKQIFQNYANPAAFDSVESVKTKIDVVKTTMQENIQQLLLNEEKLGRIESATVQLGEQSLAFRNSSKSLANKMWWQMWKTRLVIIGVVLAVLLVIIVPIAMTAKSK